MMAIDTLLVSFFVNLEHTVHQKKMKKFLMENLIFLRSDTKRKY